MTNTPAPQEDDALLFEPIEDNAPAARPGAAGRRRSIDDVPIKISAVLGKTRMTIDALDALGDGDVIALDRKVGEPIDLYVNERLVARGELTLVDGALGVALTEVVGEE